MQGFHTKELLYLGSITNDTTFTFEEDGIERSLLDFVMQQPEVVVRNGCGGYEERMSPRAEETAIVITVEGTKCLTWITDEFTPIECAEKVFPFDEKQIYPQQRAEMQICFKRYY